MGSTVTVTYVVLWSFMNVVVVYGGSAVGVRFRGVRVGRSGFVRMRGRVKMGVNVKFSDDSDTDPEASTLLFGVPASSSFRSVTLKSGSTVGRSGFVNTSGLDVKDANTSNVDVASSSAKFKDGNSSSTVGLNGFVKTSGREDAAVPNPLDGYVLVGSGRSNDSDTTRSDGFTPPGLVEFTFGALVGNGRDASASKAENEYVN